MDRREEFNGDYQQRDISLVRYFVVHHSGVNVDSTAEAVRDYHVSKLRWPGLSYNWLIHWDGQIEYVGDITTLRYQVASRNYEVIGVCILGDWSVELPPQPALDALMWLQEWVENKMIPQSQEFEVTTHRRIALPGHGTTCPGDALDMWVMGSDDDDEDAWAERQEEYDG